MASLSKLQHAQLLTYIRLVQGCLNLNEWALTLKTDHTGTEKEGEIFFDEAYRTACVHVCPTFFKKTKEEQRGIIVHELTHLLMSRVQDIGEDMSAKMGKSERKFIRTQFMNGLEYGVEMSSRLLCHLVPLPQF